MKPGHLFCELDLETLGTNPGCVVLSVGAVAFHANTGANPDKGEEPYQEVDRFYCTIDLKSAAAAGFEMDVDTLKWWLQADHREALGQLLDSEPVPMGVALMDFAAWMEKVKPDTIWSCGATFDLPVWGYCYLAQGMEKPWTHKQERCHRTMREIFGNGLDPDQVGTTHNAADDAEFQGRHLSRIFHKLHHAIGTANAIHNS